MCSGVCLAMQMADNNDAASKEGKMQIIKTYEECFKNSEFQNAMSGRGEIPVERDAYNYLKAQPVEQNITYVPAPFYYHLYNDKMDQFVQNIGSREGEQSRFTITHVEHPKKLLPLLRKWGIKVLFAVSAEKNDLHQKYNGIHIKPFPYSAMIGVSPSKNKDIKYSFMGTAVTCPEVRRKVFDMKHSEESKIIEYESWGYSKNIDEEEKKRRTARFKSILGASRFSLCPRGEGPQTIRFYESLKAGAIPVVISDNATFPETTNWNQSDWEKCMITVREDDIDNINKHLDTISEEQEAMMRKKCYVASKCFEGENLVAPVRHYYEHS